MLKQLANLANEVDGRYAAESELKFLKNYLASVENRIVVYEKIRDNEDQIIREIEEEKRAYKDDLFKMGHQDITDICRRDMISVVRASAAAMLINDLDKLREGILIWYQTIVKSFAYGKYAKLDYKFAQDVVKRHLEPQEASLMLPPLQLAQTVLGA